MSFARHTKSDPRPPSGFEAMLAGFPDSPMLSNLRSSMTAAVAEYKSATDAINRIAGDKTLTDAGRLVRQATVVRAKMDKAITDLENATSKTAAGRQLVEAELRKPLDFSGSNLAEISLAAELRAHLKNMPDEARAKFMQTAIAEVDVTSLRAIASAPSFLSGISEPVHELARDKVLSLFAPEHMASQKILAEGEAFALNLTRQLEQSVANSVDFESADEIAKNAS